MTTDDHGTEPPREGVDASEVPAQGVQRLLALAFMLMGSILSALLQGFLSAFGLGPPKEEPPDDDSTA